MSSSVRTSRRPVAGERARSRTAPRTAAAPTTLPGRATTPPAAPARRRWKLRTRHTSSSSGIASTGRRGWAAAVAALVVALAVLGTLVGVSLRDPGAQARADRAAASQARISIEQMLSYNYRSIDAQAAQIEGLLTGSFKGEFASAMDKQIKPMAVKNQTVVSAKVSDIGVMSSSPTTVKVLAFVNQARVGSDQKQPVVDQNRVMATMAKVGDRWLVSKVEAF